MARIIIAVLLFALPLAAQQPQPSPILPNAPQPKIALASAPHRPNPQIFWTGVSLLAASKTADAITTQQLLNRGGVELNSTYGRHPSPGRLAGVNALFFAGQTALFYETERNRRWYVRWGGRAYIGLVIFEHVDMALCNSAINTHSPKFQSCRAIPVF